MSTSETTEVAIVGAGPAGLTLAERLAVQGLRVLVLDRDTEPGGVPRHSDHPGYGMRDLRRFLRGPAYANLLAKRAELAGVKIQTQATVTSLDDLTLQITAPSGRRQVTARAVVLATGCREAPRPARLIPGSRPSGVLTTGWLQRAVHLEHQQIGSRAVIIGAEHVSYSAAITLREAGCATVAMVTARDRVDTFLAFQIAARLRYRFPVLTGSTVVDVTGRAALESIQVRRGDGTVLTIPCDTLVCTGDWRAENTLAKSAGLLLGSSGGPDIDAQFRTSHQGVFAIGNLLHPGATADRCAQDAQLAAAAGGPIMRWLAGGEWPPRAQRLQVGAGLAWCSITTLSATSDAPVFVEVTNRLRWPVFQVTQGERIVGQVRRPWAVPTRPLVLSRHLLNNIDPRGPDPKLTVRGA